MSRPAPQYGSGLVGAALILAIIVVCGRLGVVALQWVGLLS